MPRNRKTSRTKWCIGAIVMSCCALCVPRTTCADDEFQFWVGGTTAVDLTEQWKATIGAQARYDDRGSLARHHSDLGIVYKGLADWLDVGVNYRAIFSRALGDEWKKADRGYLNLTARHRFMGIAFSDRVRLEYSDFEGFGDFGTLRNKLTLNPPFELEPDRERLILRRYTLKPYGSYELFYDTLDNSITRHRFQAGLSVVFTDKIVGDISFIRENSTSRIDRNDFNIISANLRLLF